VAVTDRDGVYGIVQAHKAAREHGVDLIVGTEVTVQDGSTILLYAANREGYRQICRLLTRGRTRCEKGGSVVTWREVAEHADGVVAVWGGAPGRISWPGVTPADGVVPRWLPAEGLESDDELQVGLRTEEKKLKSAARAELRDEDEASFGKAVRRDPDETSDIAELLSDAFGDRLYAMVARHRRPAEDEREARVRQRARRWDLPIVAAHEVLYHDARRRPLQDVMTCVRHGCSIHKAEGRTRPNDQHALKSPEAFEELFADLPMAVDRTREIAERCQFGMDEIHYRYPSQDLPSGVTSADRLNDLVWEGALERYDCESREQVPDDVAEQLEKELELIEELEYCGYFLGMREIVEYCRGNDILCQGRGSAANSAVCYCLGITAIDPVRMDLLFERFISRERNEPPDIDLDIEHDRREEVIQWVYEEYGRERAAMVANVIRYRPKSAIRDVGKALGMAETALDRLANLSGREGVDEELLEQAGLAPDSQTHEWLMRLVGEILEFPRHLSIHPGGFVLGAEPVCDLVPIENGSMEDRTVIQWDKYDIEEMGLFKVDLLGLGALSQLHRAFDLIEEHHPEDWEEPLSMATIPAGDEPTYDMICDGDTVGVFQIESRAQMAMLPRLKPRSYYDLVVEVSIVRPGPITGEMVHPYLRRRAGKEEVTYPHPSLEPVLEKTLGVPLFQEQVMRLAVVAADYTPGEADQLRRDMGMWRQDGRMDQHRERMISRMLAKGIDKEYAERIFQQIQGFGSYGFPESHAASFALISYATSYIRRHYPTVFACSLLNSLPMGFYPPSTIVEDARHHGVVVRPVDVQFSDWEATLEEIEREEEWRAPDASDSGSGETEDDKHWASDEWALRMGAQRINGLSEKQWRTVEEARRERPFAGLADCLERTALDEGAARRLAEAGAFESFELERREALWLARGLVRTPELPMELRDVVDEERPAFRSLDTFETVNWDYRASDHSAHGHPLEPLRDRLRDQGWPTAEEVDRMENDRRVEYAGIVICRQRPSTGSGVVFLTLEDETGFVNVIIWPDIYEAHEPLVKSEHFLGVTGRIQTEDSVTHVISQMLWRPRIDVDSGQREPAHGGSHDFR
jgi:error-prone DNA polymerase